MTSSSVLEGVRNRALQTNEFSDSSESPAPSPSLAPTPSSAAAGGAGGNNDATAAKGFGWFTLVLVLLIVLFVIWRLWVRYKRQAEQRMLDYRSAQADRVLGDMQMVPNEDLDNDLI